MRQCRRWVSCPLAAHAIFGLSLTQPTDPVARGHLCVSDFHHPHRLGLACGLPGGFAPESDPGGVRLADGAPNFGNRSLHHGLATTWRPARHEQVAAWTSSRPPFNKGTTSMPPRTAWRLGRSSRIAGRGPMMSSKPGSTRQVTDDWPDVMRARSVITLARAAIGDDMGAFLCFMGVRLLEMRRGSRTRGAVPALRPSTASHYLKALLDAIFGKSNFRNEIVWSYRRLPRCRRRTSSACTT